MSFHNVRFPKLVNFGVVGGPGFSTDVTETASGFEHRNIKWSAARHKYDVTHLFQNQTEYEELKSFFMARFGRGYSFRFKDWEDFRTLQANGTMKGITSGLAVGNAAETEFQLQKTYTFGGFPFDRLISKPVDQATYTDDDDVIVPTAMYQNGSLFSSEGVGWDIDYLTGIVTFVTPPSNGMTLAWKGHFDVPVRFDTDDMPATLESYNLFNTSTTLIEVRYEEV